MEPPHLEQEDLVRLPNGRLATVERLPTTSDSESSSEESDDEYADQRGRLSNWVHQIAFPSPPTNLITSYDDTSTPAADDHINEPPSSPREPYHPSHPVPDGSTLVSVALTGTHNLYPTADLTPLDRLLHPGSLVTRPGFRQSGIVQNVSKSLYVRRLIDITPATAVNPDPTTVFCLHSSDLGVFSGLHSGDAVVRGKCVGVIDYFQEDVFVQFSDGAIACVPGHQKAIRNIDPRTPDRKSSDPFREGLYFPGQRVRALPEVWKSIAQWIRGKYSGLNEGVVKSVSVGDVGVEWIAKSLFADDGDPIPFSPGEQHVENVKFWDITTLDAFHGIDWVVGDRAFLLHQDTFLESSANPQNRQAGSAAASSGLENGGDGDMQTDDDTAWEEDASLVNDSQSESRSHRIRNGRLMKAHRRARELSRVTEDTGVISESAVGSRSASPEDVVQILQTTTKVDVLWQDGSRSVSVPALELQGAKHTDSYDFWPGQIVGRADDDLSDDENGVSNPLKRKGILVSMDSRQRTAVVRWEKTQGDGFNETEEELSVYELTSDESNLSIGDVVMRAPQGKNDDPEDEWVGVITGHGVGKCTVYWHGGMVSDVPQSELIFLKTEDDEDSDDSEESEDSEEASDDEDPTIRDAREHYYATGIDNNWGPEDDDEDHTLSPRIQAGARKINHLIQALANSQPDWIFTSDIIASSVKVAVLEAAALLEENRMHQEREGSDNKTGTDIPTDTTPQVPFNDIRLLAMFLVSRSTSQIVHNALLHYPEQPADHMLGEVGWETLRQALVVALDSLASLAPDDSNGTSLVVDRDAIDGRENGEIGAPMQIDVPDREGSSSSGSHLDMLHTNGYEQQVSAMIDSQSLSPLEKFTVVDEFVDFHKFSSVPSGSTPSVGFLSVVSKEWNRLRQSLPSGIFVRGCEQNRAQIRAAIVGPVETPYANVMFFFDILMGHKYPVEPPHVWFRSHGRRLNPNLYEDGNVCLSILGTWDGDSVESWDPKTSNLLRVLLSLQALVFVDEPYYNEAGYQKQRGTEEGHKNSEVYNESAFLLCIRHVIQTLKKGVVPPECFDIAVAHYRTVGSKILDRCRQLAQAESVEQADNTARSETNDGPLGVEAYLSSGFRRSLSQLIPVLEKALKSIASDTDPALPR